MSRYEGLIDPVIIDYILNTSVHEPEVLARLRQETADHPKSNFQIPPEQGQLMRVLVRMARAHRVIEVGVFTGYSSLTMALALPPDGQIIACDVSEEYTQIARRYWAEAGIEGKIDLRIAPASETLESLLAAGESAAFDFAFIDADKSNYDAYYERILKLMRSGGLIALDNMLWSGAVANPDINDADTKALRALNAKIHADDRVDMALAAIGDGVMLARKR